LPSPTSALARVHNNNESVSEAVHWEDLVNLTFIQDSVSVTRSPPTTKNRDDYLHINSIWGGALKEDFAVVQSISWHQNLESLSSGKKLRRSSFLWEINTNFFVNNLWDWKLPKIVEDIPRSDWFNMRENQPYLSLKYGFHPNVKASSQVGCMYTNGKMGNEWTPSHLKILQQRLLKRIYDNSGQDPILIFLHIRRGDLIESCDTSVGKLRKLVVCSFDGMEDMNRNITLLLGSDEINEGYRHDVMQMVEEEVPYIKSLDIDKISWNIVQEAVNEGLIYEELINNYYIYLLQECVRSRRVMVPPAVRVENNITIYLRQHAGACRDCFEIKDLHMRRY